MKKVKPFATEVDLCAAFIAALPKGWTNYNEVAGWDILLSRDVDGFQIGIQAKLKCNVRVVQQSLEEYRWAVMAPGPDCRAVLVPDGESDLAHIAAYLGITVIRMRVRGNWYGPLFLPNLPVAQDTIINEDWYEWAPAQRCRLPAYVPDVAAGAPAPIQLTPWKVKALKLLVLGERRGGVSRADFKFLGLDHRRWIHPNGWLRATETSGQYSVNGSPPEGLKTQHPKVFAEIAATFDDWAPRVATPPDAGEAGR